MKTFLKRLATLALSALALLVPLTTTACGADPYTITVGASSTPHAEILEYVKDDLKELGYTLNVVIYDDYVLPNTALEAGQLDANYFQHTPYLNDFNAENGTHLVAAEKIHYEPFGVYGKNVTKESFQTEKTGRTILVPSDSSNATRALFVLQEQGYITLNAGVSANDTLSDKDVADNKGNTIVLVEAAQLPRQLENATDGTIAVINGNYALAAGFKVNEDALAVESATGDAAQLYANIIAVKEGNENSEKTSALLSVLKTEKVYNYIVEHFQGGVLPTFTV